MVVLFRVPMLEMIAWHVLPLWQPVAAGTHDLAFVIDSNEAESGLESSQCGHTQSKRDVREEEGWRRNHAYIYRISRDDEMPQYIYTLAIL
jgi:hypothetical protein